MSKKGNAAPAALPALEENLGYKFKDRQLLERALTHRSWAHESVKSGDEEKARHLHNEALEFVGDSVLGLVVADELYRSYPEVTEGELSRMKHRLVSTQTLARTLLQERLQAERHVAPQYNVVETLGPPHARVFRVEVSWDMGQGGGEGGTIKAAEMEAARRALDEMGPPPETAEAEG
ncbi:MAG: hypothetical protein LC802_13395 [Acidobacteria bacterium]|nr:hypothetical protein [Acidobacteriota bacterium]